MSQALIWILAFLSRLGLRKEGRAKAMGMKYAVLGNGDKFNVHEE